MIGLYWRLIEFGFRLLYNEMAWTYDVVSQVVSLGQWREWQRTAIQFLPDAGEGAKVLELAHGTANFHSDMLQRDYQLSGIDISPAMGRIARSKLTRLGFSALLARSSAFALPFASTHFDAVVVTFPTSFFLEPIALSEVKRVLKTDGIYVVVAGAVFSGKGPFAAFLEWLYKITGQRGEMHDDVRARYEEAGLLLEIETVSLQRSNVTLLVATAR